MVFATRSIGKVRRSLQLRDIRELDSLRHGYGFGFCFAAEASGSPATLPYAGLSTGSGIISGWRRRARDTHPARPAAAVDWRNYVDFTGIAVLFLLEGALKAAHFRRVSGLVIGQF